MGDPLASTGEPELSLNDRYFYKRFFCEAGNIINDPKIVYLSKISLK
jgi:hypothetical protein